MTLETGTLVEIIPDNPNYWTRGWILAMNGATGRLGESREMADGRLWFVRLENPAIVPEDQRVKGWSDTITSAWINEADLMRIWEN